MPAIQHVRRRGAVYHWRRRLPMVSGTSHGSSECSLRTSNPRTARVGAVRLDSLGTTLFHGIRIGVLTEEETRKLFRHFALEHSRYLDGLADFERLNSSVDIEQSVRADLSQAWFYKMFAMQGESPKIRSQGRAAMLSSPRNPARTIPILSSVE